MAVNCPQSLRHKSDVGLAILSGVLLQKLLRQQHGIVSTLPQRRQTNYQHRQPKVQVLAKGSLVNSSFQIDVGRGDDPGIARQFLSPAYSLKALLLQIAKQFNLDTGRQFSNFIEEQSAPLRRFHQPYSLHGCAGERTLLMAE